LKMEEIKMGFRKFDVGSILVVRAEHDSDVIEFMTELAKRNGITSATFTAIGALKNGKLGFYDQDKHVYSEILLSTPHEIASCIGNISLKAGEPFVHAHAVLTDRTGNTKAGHLLEGKVFAAEIHLTELLGTKLIRKKDAVTGLSLWDL
jgi:predicted DNA-binding protein with PD1-like motif